LFLKVTDKEHRYIKDIEVREEGGTPAIVESIRAGLVFQLKKAIGVHNIVSKEEQIAKTTLDFLKEIKNLHLLGSPFADRLPIFSFLIEHEPTGLFLHYNFVSVLLNDLFGIQTRGGCACAGPYAQRLLGLEPEATKKFIKYLADENEELNTQKIYMNCHDFKNEALKPGFSRFSFTYFMEETQIDFVLNALKFVAEHGWKILPFYNFDAATNEWKFRNFQPLLNRIGLTGINYINGEFTFQRTAYTNEQLNTLCKTYQECMEAAYNILESISTYEIQILNEYMFTDEEENMRWFLLPSEAYSFLRNGKAYSRNRIPVIKPTKYPLEAVKRKLNTYSGGSYATRSKSHAATPQPCSHCGISDLFVQYFGVTCSSCGRSYHNSCINHFSPQKVVNKCILCRAYNSGYIVDLIQQ